MSKTPGSRQFEIAEVEELLKNRTIGPLQGFRSKMGRPFAAILRIVRDEDISNFKLEFDFGQNDDEGEDGEGVDFTGQTPLGPCPKCNGGVYEMGLAYVCEHSVAKPKTCDFRSGRIILQQEILPEQMAKLLNEGKTDLLPGFVSQRTRRPFKAFLVRGKDGKTSFEFEERKAKPGAKGKAAAAEVAGDGADEAAPAAKKVAAKKVAAKKVAVKKVAVKKAPAKTAAVKAVAKKAPAKRAPAAAAKK
jgi:DNA topoisomerase-3